MIILCNFGRFFFNQVTKYDIGKSWKPKVGLEFEDLEEAQEFWKKYGEKVGFEVRKAIPKQAKGR